MKTCCVTGCQVTSSKDVTFFEFPTSRTLRRKWLDCISLSEKLTVTSLVCSQHFSLDDYETVRGKTRLKRKVVPSIFQNQGKNKNNSKPFQNDTEDVRKPNNICIKTDVIENSALVTASENKPQSSIGLNNEKSTGLNDDFNCEKKLDKNHKEKDKLSSTDNHQKILDDEIDDYNNVLESDSTESVNGKEKMESKEKEKPDNIIKRDPQTVPYSDPLEKEDIEDMITNYQIKNKKKKAMSPLTLNNKEGSQCEKAAHEEESEQLIEFEVPGVIETPPVFIEVSVGQGENPAKEAENDCLMLLESVQVDVDPALLLLPEREMEDEADAFEITTDSEAEDNVNAKTKKKDDPVSLLTSSDEDEVIIQEPKIDTVEVSDETDEDDVPLMKLVNRKPKSDIKPCGNPMYSAEKNLAKLMWGMIEYFCMQCHFSTTNRGEYSRHLSIHSKVLQICQVCNYTTASKSQFVRHKRKHKDERRFKCHLCDYKARHNMSLIYHMKSHSGDPKTVKNGYNCDKCGFHSNIKSAALKHIKSCRASSQMHSCDKCSYATKRRSDLKRHKSRRHNDVDDDDIDFV